MQTHLTASMELSIWAKLCGSHNTIYIIKSVKPSPPEITKEPYQ